jgi:hypothetical protein
MSLDQIAHTVQPYTTSAGLATVVAAGTHSAASVVRALATRTLALSDTIRSRTSIVASCGLGAGVAYWLHDSGYNYHATIPHVLQAVGSVPVGAAAGAVIWKPISDHVTRDRLWENVRLRARQGAIAGAVALPAAYGLYEVMHHYLR